ncbi:MAG: ABC transporter substrate-binding protein [Actinomycetota bacterium]
MRRGERGRWAARWLCAGLAIVAVGAGIPAAASVDRQGPDQRSAPGGVLRLSAQEEPFCADWIASCAGLTWGNWALGVHTLPQAFRVTPAGEYVPGPVLAGAPVRSAGPPLTVSYPIAPEAVWSDGTPITAQDFAYTWKQIVTGRDIYDTTGYTSIESIDTSDPKTAVVTFREPFAGWRDLFGGFFYILPSHILEGRNRHKVMKDGYAFSGGPWMLDGGAKGWDKGRSITLVPNPRYWADQPQIGKVVFQFIPESAAEAQALKSGQVAAAYPIPQTGMLDEFDRAGLRYEVGSGNTYEAFWLNNEAFPLDRLPVRQALLYATDRQAVVDQILRPAVREGRVLQSFVVPSFPEYFTPAFDGYARDQDRVDALMTGDGWTRGGDGIWVRNGKRAALSIATTAGNEGRELAEQLWQSQLQQAGFDLTIKNASADLLFGRLVPRGRFVTGLYAQVGTPDPGLCVIFCSKNVPTKANGFVGQNYTRTSSPSIDDPWSAADREIDPVARVASVKQGQIALAQAAVSIPLYQLPTLFVWDARKIAGPLQDNATEGPFFNLEQWSLK